jgi:hypothetical protein
MHSSKSQERGQALQNSDLYGFRSLIALGHSVRQGPCCGACACRCHPCAAAGTSGDLTRALQAHAQPQQEQRICNRPAGSHMQPNQQRHPAARPAQGTQWQQQRCGSRGRVPSCCWQCPCRQQQPTGFPAQQAAAAAVVIFSRGCIRSRRFSPIRLCCCVAAGAAAGPPRQHHAYYQLRRCCQQQQPWGQGPVQAGQQHQEGRQPCTCSTCSTCARGFPSSSRRLLPAIQRQRRQPNSSSSTVLCPAQLHTLLGGLLCAQLCGGAADRSAVQGPLPRGV